MSLAQTTRTASGQRFATSDDGVIAQGDHWFVKHGDLVAGPFASNAAAWAALDRMTREPVLRKRSSFRVVTWK